MQLIDTHVSNLNDGTVTVEFQGRVVIACPFGWRPTVASTTTALSCGQRS